MNQIDLRKHHCQISLFIVEFHTNRVSIIAANSEALFCFLLHICTELNNYLSEKYFFLIFIRLQIICFWNWHISDVNAMKHYWHFGLLVVIQMSKN